MLTKVKKKNDNNKYCSMFFTLNHSLRVISYEYTNINSSVN